MDYYAGIDVSLDASSVCVVDASGKIVKEAKVLSELDDLIAWFKALPFALARIGLEAGDRCRNGSMRALRRQDSPWSCWRRGMSVNRLANVTPRPGPACKKDPRGASFCSVQRRHPSVPAHASDEPSRGAAVKNGRFSGGRPQGLFLRAVSTAA